MSKGTNLGILRSFTMQRRYEISFTIKPTVVEHIMVTVVRARVKELEAEEPAVVIKAIAIVGDTMSTEGQG